jgi:hypothetical protein
VINGVGNHHFGCKDFLVAADNLEVAVPTVGMEKKPVSVVLGLV